MLTTRFPEAAQLTRRSIHVMLSQVPSCFRLYVLATTKTHQRLQQRRRRRHPHPRPRLRSATLTVRTQNLS